MYNYDSNYLNHPAAAAASKKIEVIDLESNTVTNYTSVNIRGARDLYIGFASIGTYLKRNQKR